MKLITAFVSLQVVHPAVLGAVLGSQIPELKAFAKQAQGAKTMLVVEKEALATLLKTKPSAHASMVLAKWGQPAFRKRFLQAATQSTRTLTVPELVKEIKKHTAVASAIDSSRCKGGNLQGCAEFIDLLGSWFPENDPEYCSVLLSAYTLCDQQTSRDRLCTALVENFPDLPTMEFSRHRRSAYKQR